MSRITPTTIRNKIVKSGLTKKQVQEITGVSRAWFMRMLSTNELYKFDEPNPKWMDHINKFLDSFQQYKKDWRWWSDK